MARFFQYAVFLLLALQYQTVVAVEPLTMIAIATTVISLCQLIWESVEKSKIFDQHSYSDKIENPFFGESDEEILLKELRRIAASSNQVKKELHAVKDMLLGEVTVDVERLQKLTEILRKIFTNLVIIDNTYNDFLEYVARSETYDESLLVKFSEDAMAEGPCGIIDILRENNQHLRKSIIGEPPIQDLIVENADIFLKNTKDSQSPQQFLYNLMIAMMFSEVKAYFIMRYSITILKKIKKRRNYEGHVNKLNKDFGERLNETIGAFKEAMKDASREFYRIDPDAHVEDITYLKLNHVYQAVIINEKNLIETNTCNNYCDKESAYKRSKCVADKDPLCRKQLPCDGWLTKCGYKIPNPMKVCLVADPWTSDRRYEYLIDGDNVVKGKRNMECQKPILELKAFWNDFNDAIGRCDYCTCTCYDPKPHSDNKFSVKLNKAIYKENYVVTGAQFVKNGHVIYLQLQEGKLQAGGFIDESTLNWASFWDLPEENFVIEGNHHHDINLDDIHAPEGHVIVGLGLKEIRRDEVKKLGLQILTKPINFTSGHLLDGPTNHMIFEPSWSKDKEVAITEYDIPINFIAKSVNISQSGQFVRLQRSGLDGDLGQNTIPFFDKQSVTTSPSALVSGVGLYHKNRQNSGGFIGLKLFTFNYEPYLNPNL